MAVNPFELDQIHVDKNQIVWELFTASADGNYATARWCFFQALYLDFYWLAVHSLEKYLKAALLLNGQSAKSYGHDITALYPKVHLLAPELLPAKLTKPDKMRAFRWRDETPEQFLSRLWRYGNPHNRYKLFGYVQFPEDIYKLDQMVYAVRRLCRFLDASSTGKNGSPTNRDLLRDVITYQEQYWHLRGDGKLEKVVAGKLGDELRHVLLNHNFPFAPDDYQHTPVPQASSSHAAVLHRIVLLPLKGDPNAVSTKRALELCNWVLDKIKLHGGVKEQLKEARDDHVKKARGETQ